MLVTIVAFAGTALGQGQVTLANNSSSLIRVGNATNGTPVAIGSLLFQLYYGTLGTPADALAPVGPQVGTSAISVGRIANTVIDIPFPPIPFGFLATFQIWGWSSSFTTYAEAANGGGLVGKSILFVAQTSPDSPNPFLPTPLAGLYPGFAVNPIPEPSTWALLALGGTILVWRVVRRRRRQKL